MPTSQTEMETCEAIAKMTCATCKTEKEPYLFPPFIVKAHLAGTSKQVIRCINCWKKMNGKRYQ
jgi:hypothetical protein